jgi:L-ascorbate metabolism protein UlaG (beta-lactamase superfamily)
MDWKAMRVYKFIHSCLVVEEGEDKILFDPGMFSFMEGLVTPDAFKDVGTIIITHNHPDHVDVAALQKIVELSGAMVITNSETQDALTKEGIKALALVVAAPWTTEVTTAKFAETIAPQMVIPVHDGYVKSFFQKMRYDNYDRYFSTKGITFQHLVSPGDGVEIA